MTRLQVRPAEPFPMNYPRVVLLIDNAPWHRGELIDEAMADNPHLEFKRLPSYSPVPFPEMTVSLGL